MLSKPPDRILESGVVSRLMWRLMPFLFLLYVVAYLDRINVSFAILQMRGPLHLTDVVYGRAAGIFFAGYFLFQVPSSVVLEKVGVRRWISGLMVVWGLVSCGMIFIRGPISFYTLRFLLGAAEAGFFPGMILYLKRWFPPIARGRAVAWFMTANPLAGIVGSPISGALLAVHTGRFVGWQWLFLLEGMPAIVLGVAAYWMLTETPGKAKWLSSEQRDWLVAELEREHASGLKGSTQVGGQSEIWRVLGDGKIWMLSLVYFGIPACMYGVTLWLPSAIRSLSGLGYFSTGLITAVPYALTAVAMVLVGRHSDLVRERRWHTALPGLAGAAALAVAGYSSAAVLIIAGMSLGMLGAQSMVGPFWALTTSRLREPTAAVGIAVINSVGNLGGYFGPFIIGWARAGGGSFRGGLLAVAAVLATSSGLALMAGTETVRAAK